VLNSTRNIKIALGILVIFSIVILSIYYWLGGFNQLEIQTVSMNDYYVVGHYFEGTYKSDTVSSYFMEIKQMIETRKLNGILTIVYYQEPIGKRGMMKSFIGAALEDTTVTIPPGYEQRLIQVDKVVQAKVDSHVAVMPNPEKINRRLREHAQGQGLELVNFSIERYLSDWEVITEIPVVP